MKKILYMLLFFAGSIATTFGQNWNDSGIDSLDRTGVNPYQALKRSKLPNRIVITGSQRKVQYVAPAWLLSTQTPNQLTVGTDGKLRVNITGLTPEAHTHGFNEVSGLQAALDAKLSVSYTPTWSSITDKPSLATVATTGNYTDLTNKPSIPTVPTGVSAFTNDAGYLTTSYTPTWSSITGKPTLATVATTGNYTDLTNKPSIPTVPTGVSAFTNDAGYLTPAAENISAAVSGQTLAITVNAKSTSVTLPSSGGSANVDFAFPDDYGAVGNGTTNDTSPFLTALANTKYVKLYAGKTYLITTATIPTGTVVEVDKGATLKISGTLTVNGTIKAADNQRVFDFSSGGTVAFGSTSNSHVYSQWFGSSLSEIQKLATASRTGQTIVFNSPSFTLAGPISFAGKGLVLDLNGSVFNFSGSNSGFSITGVVPYFQVIGNGATLLGDFVNRDSNPALRSIGLLFGDVQGSKVSNVSVKDITIRGFNVGIKSSAGADASGNFTAANVGAYHNFDNVKVMQAIGVVGGTGYGIQLHRNPHSTISNCFFDSCQRHSIYVAEGGYVNLLKNKVFRHRINLNTGQPLAAISYSRGGHGIIAENLIYKATGLGIEVSQDKANAAIQDNDALCQNMVIKNNQIIDPTNHYLFVGSYGANWTTITDLPTNISIENNNFSSTGTASSVFICQGKGVKFLQNTLLSPNTSYPFEITADGGVANIDEILVKNNEFKSLTSAITIPVVVQTGSVSVIADESNTFRGGTAFRFLGTTTTNTNLIARDSRFTTRILTASGSTPLVTGIDRLFLNNSGVTTISTFTGGSEGQIITLYFGNANTTISNSNIYTLNSANFTGTNYDTMTLMLVGGFWREISESRN